MCSSSKAYSDCFPKVSSRMWASQLYKKCTKETRAEISARVSNFIVCGSCLSLSFCSPTISNSLGWCFGDWEDNCSVQRQKRKLEGERYQDIEAKSVGPFDFFYNCFVPSSFSFRFDVWNPCSLGHIRKPSDFKSPSWWLKIQIRLRGGL